MTLEDPESGAPSALEAFCHNHTSRSEFSPVACGGLSMNESIKFLVWSLHYDSGIEFQNANAEFVLKRASIDDKRLVAVVRLFDIAKKRLSQRRW